MGGMPRPGPSGTPPPGPLALSFWLQVALLAPILLLYGWEGIRTYRAGRLAGKIKRDLWLIVVCQIIGLLAWFNEARVPGIWRYLVATLGLNVTQILAAALVIGLGWCAYRFKRRNKLYYGYLEVFFGILSAAVVVRKVDFAALGSSNLNLALVVALVGSAYVVARGLSNCYEARHPTTPAG